MRLSDVPAWSKSEQMAKERENFGFYFAAHPVEQWRAVASANGARSYASLMETGVPGGGRAQAVMAAMVESVNRGKTRRGWRGPCRTRAPSRPIRRRWTRPAARAPASNLPNDFASARAGSSHRHS